MQKTKYIWFNGNFISWEKAKIHLLSHCLHYGSGVFEGIRCYQTEKGPAVFRLKDHIKRLLNSAKALQIKINYSLKEIEEIILEIIRKNKIQECYLRPIIFYGYGKMGLHPQGAEVNFAIALWSWRKYLKEKVKVKISKFIRLHLQSIIPSAKVCGYYVNSILATLDVQKSGYDEAILLDYRGFIAEGPGENVFLVKNKKLYTPKLDSILPGITRDTVIKIAKDLNVPFYEKKDITVEELKNADEIFLTGTAVEITPVYQIDNKLINKGKIGEIIQKIKDYYQKIVHGEIKKYNFWLSYV